MIHHWECIKCTNTWESCCFQELFDPNHDPEEYSLQLDSHLCSRCYKQLKAKGGREWNLLEEKRNCRHKATLIENLIGYDSTLHREVQFELSCPEFIAKDRAVLEKHHRWRLENVGIESTGTYPHYEHKKVGPGTWL